MLKLGLLTCSLCSVAIGQTPFVNFYWEASDGGAWRRDQLVTMQRVIHARLTAEWAPRDGRGFGSTRFDAVITDSDESDGANAFFRPDPFTLNSQTIIASRFGNTIKIDDSHDTAPAGSGPQGISCAQTNGIFGEHVNEDNPVSIFFFDMSLADTAGTRRISSMHLSLSNGTGNARIWGLSGQANDVFSTVAPVDIVYVPAPKSLSLLACLAIRLRRKRKP